MKLSPPASSSDLELARAIARKLSRLDTPEGRVDVQPLPPYVPFPSGSPDRAATHPPKSPQKPPAPAPAPLLHPETVRMSRPPVPDAPPPKPAAPPQKPAAAAPPKPAAPAPRPAAPPAPPPVPPPPDQQIDEEVGVLEDDDADAPAPPPPPPPKAVTRPAAPPAPPKPPPPPPEPEPEADIAIEGEEEPADDVELEVPSGDVDVDFEAEARAAAAAAAAAIPDPEVEAIPEIEGEASAPTWAEIVMDCLYLARASGVLLIDSHGQVAATGGDWPAPGVESIAGRLVPAMDKALRGAPTRSVSVPIGTQHLTAWRVPVGDSLMTIGFVADAPLKAEVRPAIDAEVKRGTP